MEVMNVFEESAMSKLNRALKKSHVRIMNEKEARWHCGAIHIGESRIREDIPTACTDGVNKYYGLEYMSKLTHEEHNGVVLHELLHVELKHLFNYADLFKENAQLANAAADYVVNGIIVQMDGYNKWIKLPKGALVDPKFFGWSVRQIYRFLKTGRDRDGQQHEREERYEDNDDEQQGQPGRSGGGKPEKKEKEKDKSGSGDPTDEQDDEQDGDGEPQEGAGQPRKIGKVVIDGEEFDVQTHDEHDYETAAEMSEEEVAEKIEEIDEAVREGGVIAGLLGKDLPLEVKEAVAPVTDWTEIVRQFMTSNTTGRGDYTWRKLDMRRLIDDVIMPGQESESLGDIGLFTDTSGSTIGPVLDKMCQIMETFCKQCIPDNLRVLYWDTEVRGEQVFRSNYDGLRSKLRPVGGGGTKVGCLPPYVIRRGYKFDFVIVLTDGWVEDNFTWNINVPTLWVVTENTRFKPPKGQVVYTSNK